MRTSLKKRFSIEVKWRRMLKGNETGYFILKSYIIKLITAVATAERRIIKYIRGITKHFGALVRDTGYIEPGNAAGAPSKSVPGASAWFTLP